MNTGHKIYISSMKKKSMENFDWLQEEICYSSDILELLSLKKKPVTLFV